MRSFPLITSTFLAFALALSASACTDDDTMETVASADTSGDADGDGDPGDGDGDPPMGCFDQPPICAQFVSCIGGLLPDQLAGVEGAYGEMGTCWCNATEAHAQDCFETCHEELEKALDGPGQTVRECHENWCTIDELDPEQPYGPISGGSCTPYKGPQGDDIPQTPLMNPLNVVGGYCAPECSGLANACPEHSQTSAQGTCYLNGPNGPLCASRCYVDPRIIGGTQCQCGAICRPDGSFDGENNARGLCTFE